MTDFDLKIVQSIYLPAKNKPTSRKSIVVFNAEDSFVQNIDKIPVLSVGDLIEFSNQIYKVCNIHSPKEVTYADIIVYKLTKYIVPIKYKLD